MGFVVWVKRHFNGNSNVNMAFICEYFRPVNNLENEIKSIGIMFHVRLLYCWLSVGLVKNERGGYDSCIAIWYKQ